MYNYFHFLIKQWLKKISQRVLTLLFHLLNKMLVKGTIIQRSLRIKIKQCIFNSLFDKLINYLKFLIAYVLMFTNRLID